MVLQFLRSFLIVSQREADNLDQASALTQVWYKSAYLEKAVYLRSGHENKIELTVVYSSCKRDLDSLSTKSLEPIETVTTENKRVVIYRYPVSASSWQ